MIPTYKDILSQIELIKNLKNIRETEFERHKALNELDRMSIEYFGVENPGIGEEAAALLKKKHGLV